MLKDITIGQYFPGESAIHRLDPRMKLIMTTIYIVALFVANNVGGLLVCVAIGLAVVLLSNKYVANFSHLSSLLEKYIILTPKI